MKNLKIYLSSFLVASSLSLTSCSEDIENLNHTYEDAIFFNKYGYTMEKFLKEQDVVELKFIGFEPLYYYEKKVSEPIYENGEFSFRDSWVRIEDINEHFGIVRRVDVLYKFVSINMDGDKPVVEELVVNDLRDVTEEYKYMYKDDYVTLKKSEPFYVNKGKILEKVR